MTSTSTAFCEQCGGAVDHDELCCPACGNEQRPAGTQRKSSPARAAAASKAPTAAHQSARPSTPRRPTAQPARPWIAPQAKPWASRSTGTGLARTGLAVVLLGAGLWRLLTVLVVLGAIAAYIWGGTLSAHVDCLAHELGKPGLVGTLACAVAH